MGLYFGPTKFWWQIIQLLSAVIVWAVTEYLSIVDVEAFAAIISLSGGAFLANITSVVLYVGETLKSKR